MTTTRNLVGLLSGALVAAGITAAATGCDMLKKGDDEETDTSTAAEEAPPPEPEPTTEATAEASDDEVKTYPNQIEASGTYRLLRSFNVYNEADLDSKRLGGVGAGTIIHLKAQLGQWLLIKWPSGPGEMTPGWIQVSIRNRKLAMPVENYDAGIPVVDAGKPVVDAGKPVPDAGGRPRLKLKYRPNKK